MRYKRKDLDGDPIIVTIKEDSNFPTVWFKLRINYEKKILGIKYLSNAYERNKVIDECVDFTCEDFEKLVDSFVERYNEHQTSLRKNKAIRKKLKECGK